VRPLFFRIPQCSAGFYASPPLVGQPTILRTSTIPLVASQLPLTTAYRTTKNAPLPQGQGLNDLYIRFYRMAEHRIAEMSGHGVICFISNYSWLDGLSFTGMRERYLEVFDDVWIDNLHGDRIISEYAPDGKTSETIFATQGTSPGIKIGTAIAVLTKKKNKKTTNSSVLYRDVEEARAADRRNALLRSLTAQKFAEQYSSLEPRIELGLPLKPLSVERSYLAWPELPALFPTSFPGVKTSRDKFLIDFDKQALIERMESFFDPDVSYEEWNALHPNLAEKTNRFDPKSTREQLVKRGFLPKNIVRYQYRPFDVRWLYWEPETKLLDEKRENYFAEITPTNIWLSAGQRNRMEDFYQPQFTRLLADHHIVESNVGMFPLLLHSESRNAPLYQKDANSSHPNLSSDAIKFLGELRCEPEDLFYHTLATLNSPKYRGDNRGALRQDWPRIPLPASNKLFASSTELGGKIAAYFNTETAVKGITSGDMRAEILHIGVIARSGGGSLKETDLALTAGWGHAGKGGVTMPGRGKLLEREYSTAEHKAIVGGAKDLGLSEKEALAHLGDKTCDVYLNDSAYWSNIPIRVWEYTIGGYQVIKKWLSYREEPLLGRPLTKDEVRYVQEMARRIAGILLLEPALDANYEAIKSHTFPWPPKSYDGRPGLGLEFVRRVPQVPVFGTWVLGSLRLFTFFLDIQPSTFDFQLPIPGSYSYTEKSFQYYRILLPSCY
jgi:Type ISP C-terminal specificity domain